MERLAVLSTMTVLDPLRLLCVHCRAWIAIEASRILGTTMLVAREPCHNKDNWTALADTFGRRDNEGTAREGQAYIQ